MPLLILVADTEWVANEVKAALAVGGWEIMVMTDPREAVAAVQELAPNAVAIDMQVGSKGGFAVIRAIRQFQGHRPRTVLLLDRSADSFIARRAGADAYVLKPINTHELRAALAVDEEE